MILLLETLVRRWYAVAFVVGFFWAASNERGWRRALRFWATASIVAFVFEYASTHTGFPYGRYSFTGYTRGDEIYLSNVPLFVPVSYAVIIWAGRAIAVVGFRARTRAAIPWLGALGTVLIDLVIEPVTAHGNDWFLGNLYFWHHPGGYLGVPLTNFLGIYAAAWLALYVDEVFEIGRDRSFDIVRGTTLALSVMAFHVILALGIRQWRAALGAAVISAAVVWMILPELRATWSGAPAEPTIEEPRTEP